MEDLETQVSEVITKYARHEIAKGDNTLPNGDLCEYCHRGAKDFYWWYSGRDKGITYEPEINGEFAHPDDYVPYKN